jgi:hypothetical protein
MIICLVSGNESDSFAFKQN